MSAVTQSINPSRSPIIMAMSQDAGVVVSIALNVGVDVYAPNSYNKKQVDRIASSKQATLSSSTLIMSFTLEPRGLSQLEILIRMEQSML